MIQKSHKFPLWRWRRETVAAAKVFKRNVPWPSYIARVWGSDEQVMSFGVRTRKTTDGFLRNRGVNTKNKSSYAKRETINLGGFFKCHYFQLTPQKGQ